MIETPSATTRKGHSAKLIIGAMIDGLVFFCSIVTVSALQGNASDIVFHLLGL